MFKNRIIFVEGSINGIMANEIIRQILYLDHKSNENIFLYINSGGGSVSDGLAIYDTMQFCRSKVITIGIGQCCSMAAFLLVAGDERYVLPNCDIMFHLPRIGHIEGTATDIEIEARHSRMLKNKVVRLLAVHCRKSPQMVEQFLQHDFWITPQQAMKHGIVDGIIGG